jgi:hypothetical protein
MGRRSNLQIEVDLEQGLSMSCHDSVTEHIKVMIAAHLDNVDQLSRKETEI